MLTFFNSEIHQRTNINNDVVSVKIIENNFFEKQNQNEILKSKQLKINKTKKDKLIKKYQNTTISTPRSQEINKKDFELKKDVIKLRSHTPQLTRKLNTNKLIIKDNIFSKKLSMSAMPNIENFRSVKLNQKIYSCSKSQGLKSDKNKLKVRIMNKNITISVLLGNNFYNYNPNFINISKLLEYKKKLNEKDINISKLLNTKTDNYIICN